MLPRALACPPPSPPPAQADPRTAFATWTAVNDKDYKDNPIVRACWIGLGRPCAHTRAAGSRQNARIAAACSKAPRAHIRTRQPLLYGPQEFSHRLGVFQRNVELIRQHNEQGSSSMKVGRHMRLGRGWNFGLWLLLPTTVYPHPMPISAHTGESQNARVL